jgi:uncharacterized membrane protein YhaH (DUF805 family)
MSFSQLYFSTEGRIPRSTYWLKYYLPFTIIGVLSILLDLAVGTLDMEAGYGVFNTIAGLLMLWPTIAVHIKRLHDRDRSGWFYLLFLVPLVNIWVLIEVMFLKGTEGPNRFGEDPLGDVVEVFE